MGLIFEHPIEIDYKSNDYQIIEIAHNNGGLQYIIERKEDDGTWTNLHDTNIADRDIADQIVIDLEVEKYRKYVTRQVNPLKDYFKNKM